VAAPSSSPFANILHQDTIRRLSDDRTFDRGRAYFSENRVVELSRQPGALIAKVRGGTEYEVRLWVKEDKLAFRCSCPLGMEQTFCKHAVAVALAWLATPQGIVAASPDRDLVSAALDTIPRTGLVEILLEEAAQSPRLRERILARAKKS
jgi:uncharacterized Zn finger protein